MEYLNEILMLEHNMILILKGCRLLSLNRFSMRVSEQVALSSIVKVWHVLRDLLISELMGKAGQKSIGMLYRVKHSSNDTFRMNGTFVVCMCSARVIENDNGHRDY